MRVAKIGYVRYSLIVIFCIIASCQGDKQYDIILDLNDYKNKEQLENIVDSTKTILLETNKEAVIAGIDGLIFVDSILFIADRKQKSLFMFDFKGNYIRKICNIGKGPGEYISLTSFSVDSLKNIVYVHDDMQRKIIRYNYKLQFINEINFGIKKVVRSVIKLNDGNFLFIKPDYDKAGKNGIWEVDYEGNFVKQWHQAHPNFKWCWYSMPFYSKSDNRVSFYDCYSNSIYEYHDVNMKKVLSINFLQKMPKELYEIDKPHPDHLTKGYYINRKFISTKNCYFLQYYSSNKGLMHVMIDKNTHAKKKFKSVLDKKDTLIIEDVYNYDDYSMVVPVWLNDEDNPALKILYLTNKLY